VRLRIASRPRSDSEVRDAQGTGDGSAAARGGNERRDLKLFGSRSASFTTRSTTFVLEVKWLHV
jgi:hypothetical protein